MNAFGPDWEDGVPRVVATEKDRVNKLKALGNSIVPQVAYQILLAMDSPNSHSPIVSAVACNSASDGWL
jgi:hypothetical protein